MPSFFLIYSHPVHPSSRRGYITISAEELRDINDIVKYVVHAHMSCMLRTEARLNDCGLPAHAHNFAHNIFTETALLAT